MRRLAALIGCVVLGAAGPAAAEIIDRVVAVVNDEVVTLSEVEDAAAGALREAEAESDPVARQQKRQRQLRAFLDLIIGDKLVKQEAAKARIVVREPEVEAHLDRVMQQQGWGQPQLQQYLLAQGLTLAAFKEQVRDQLLQRKVVGRFLRDKITLTDRDVLNYCREKTTEAASSYAVEAAHIVLRLPEGATPAEDAALRRKAEEIRDRAKAGEDFAALAKQYSDIGGDNGGALGTVNHLRPARGRRRRPGAHAGRLPRRARGEAGQEGHQRLRRGRSRDAQRPVPGAHARRDGRLDRRSAQEGVHRGSAVGREDVGRPPRGPGRGRRRGRTVRDRQRGA